MALRPTAWIKLVVMGLSLVATAEVVKVGGDIDTASELLHAFWNRDPRVADLVARPIRLSGLVAVVGDGGLSLQTDERGYTVQCLDAQTAPLAGGILVVVEATAPTERLRGIELARCRVLWTEKELEGLVPAGVDPLAFFARSRELCHVLERADFERVTNPRQLRWLMALEAAQRVSRQYFVSRRLNPLPCDSPLIPILTQCGWEHSFSGLLAAPIVERDTVYAQAPRVGPAEGTECASPLVQGVLEAPLEDDALVEHDDKLRWRRAW